MTDIVERLRMEKRYMPTYLAEEAANEIERLRAKNERLCKQIERLLEEQRIAPCDDAEFGMKP